MIITKNEDINYEHYNVLRYKPKTKMYGYDHDMLEDYTPSNTVLWNKDINTLCYSDGKFMYCLSMEISNKATDVDTFVNDMLEYGLTFKETFEAIEL